MTDQIEALKALGHQQSQKLVGMDADELAEASRSGARLIVVAARSCDLMQHGASLLLAGEDRAIWLLMGSVPVVAELLQDEAVWTIAADDLPGMQLLMPKPEPPPRGDRQ